MPSARHVSGVLQSLNEAGRATGGELQAGAELAGCQLGRGREVLHCEHLVLREAESPRERSAVVCVGERLAQERAAYLLPWLVRADHR
jgi:hypothetical protein